MRLCKTCYDSFPTGDVAFVEFDPRRRMESTRRLPTIEEDIVDDTHNQSEHEEEILQHEEVEDEQVNANDGSATSCFSSDDAPDDESSDGGDGGVHDDQFSDPTFFDTRDPNESDNYKTYDDYDLSYTHSSGEDDNMMPFETTHGGDSPLDIEHSGIPGTDRVSGHVILNQATSCLFRFGKKTNGKQNEKYFIRNLCSTTPNQACPLTTPEAALMPCIFYSEASRDNISILGARPLWAVTSDAKKYGFSSTNDVIRSRLTAAGLTGTDTYYLRHNFDVLSNIALTHGDSRQIINDFLETCLLD